MAYLPLANILHHKLRSVLSTLGIGISICMLVTLSGLSRGTLDEVGDRWESVDADLIVFPRGLGSNVSIGSGFGLGDKYADKIRRELPDVVERVVPVFTRQMKLGGQDQMIAGVDPGDWPTIVGGRQLTEGRMYDPDNRFADWIVRQMLSPANGDEEELDIPKAELSHPDHNGLELVIDTRLARAGGFRLNQTVTAADHQWRIVGIVPHGGLARVYMPRRTAQFLFGGGDVRKSTLLFVKLKAGADAKAAAARIAETTRQDVIGLDRYRGMLTEKFAVLFPYVDAVNAIALVIAFLFIMNTLYTMVLQRRRDIAILKSCGAGNTFILAQILAESLLLTGAGLAAGIGLSFLVGYLIEEFLPLLTVRITWGWLLTATVAAVGGAVLSAIYPAWQATRVDMVEILTLE